MNLEAIADKHKVGELRYTVIQPQAKKNTNVSHRRRDRINLRRDQDALPATESDSDQIRRVTLAQTVHCYEL